MTLATPSPGSVSFIFGVVTMLAGLVGVSLGAFSATRLRPHYPRADPVVCAAGLLLSMPFMFGGAILCEYNTNWAYVLLFVGQVFLNLNWSIVADMLLVRREGREAGWGRGRGGLLGCFAAVGLKGVNRGLLVAGARRVKLVSFAMRRGSLIRLNRTKKHS